MSNARAAILLELGEFIALSACARLPERIVQKAKACVLYGLAVGIASLRAPQPAQAARAVDLDSAAGADRGGRTATRFIDHRQLDFPQAAFCNSVLLHSRVQEDAHPCGHLGVVAVPATLACAEAHASSGEDALAALVAAYEVALRIGRDHGASLSARGFRTTPAYGPFAAAACGSRLMKLQPEACANALALAANTAGGLREFVDAGTGEFPFHAGFAARNGLYSASLAAAGVAAAESTLTGKAGFFGAFGSDSVDYARRLCAGLGDEFELESIAYKPYPICQFLRGVVRGAVELKQQARDRRATSIAVHMHPSEADFIGIRYAGPFASFSQAFMSAQFCTALAWTTGDVTFAGLHDFTDQNVIDLTPKVTVIADSSRARYAPRLEVTFEDASSSEWEAREGANAYLLDWDTAVRMNAKLCAEAGVAAVQSQALATAVTNLDRAPDVRQVIAAIGACVAQAQRSQDVAAERALSA